MAHPVGPGPEPHSVDPGPEPLCRPWDIFDVKGEIEDHPWASEHTIQFSHPLEYDARVASCNLVQTGGNTTMARATHHTFSRPKVQSSSHHKQKGSGSRNHIKGRAILTYVLRTVLALYNFSPASLQFPPGTIRMGHYTQPAYSPLEDPATSGSTLLPCPPSQPHAWSFCVCVQVVADLTPFDWDEGFILRSKTCCIFHKGKSHSCTGHNISIAAIDCEKGGNLAEMREEWDVPCKMLSARAAMQQRLLPSMTSDKGQHLKAFTAGFATAVHIQHMRPSLDLSPPTQRKDL
eukprot:1159575-Pelagomonas_calceolata.AAC.3